MQLNFDKFNFQIKTQNNRNYIWDKVRKGYFVLTQEEYVRQHCIHQLEKNGFSLARLSIEQSLPKSKKRYDAILYDNAGNPKLLIECKAPTVHLSTKIIEQVTSYISLLEVPNILLTNGRFHFLIKRSVKELKITQEFPELSSISH